MTLFGPDEDVRATRVPFVDDEPLPAPPALLQLVGGVASFRSSLASSAGAGSLSLSHRVMAARSSCRAAARFPPLRSSRPSSRYDRPCTQFRASRSTALFKSAAPSTVFPS